MVEPALIAAKSDALLEWWDAGEWRLSPSDPASMASMNVLLRGPAYAWGGHSSEELDADGPVALKPGTIEHVTAVLRGDGWDVAVS